MPIRRAGLLLLVAASLAVSASGCGGAQKTASSSVRILFASSRDGAWALYSMNADGSGQRRFAGSLGGIEPGAEGEGIGVPSLSPDGSEVLVPLNGTTAITLATGAAHHLAPGQPGVVWAPDGRQFAYSRFFSGPIFVGGRGHRRALPGTGNGTPNAWSPNGKWILFSRQAGTGPYYLWCIHPNGTGLRRLTGYSAGSDVLWLPDGRAEYVGSHDTDVTNLEFLVALDVTTAQVEVIRKIQTPDTTAWSPDGKTLVFAASENGQRPSTLYAVDASGGDLRRLTPPGKEQYDATPAWSPDGKSIVFTRRRDGGAARYASEIWTMLADGSHQFRLTQAYPDGGENVDPLWVSGPVHVANDPRAYLMGNNTLRVPYLVAGVAAQRSLVAVAPYGNDQVSGGLPTPPLLVWRPGSQPPESLVGSLCGVITPEFFTGNRLAVECDHNFLDEHQQAVLVFDLRTAVPVEPIHAYNAFFGQGTQSGTIVDGPVFSGGKVEFETSHWVAGRKTRSFVQTKLPRQLLWAADGSHRTKLRSAHRLGTLITGDHDWLVFLVGKTIEITSPSGRPVRRLHLPALHLSDRSPAPNFLITGNDLIRLGGGKLEGWDVRTGHVLMDRSVPAKAQLDAADGQYVVYAIGADIHVLSRTADYVIHTRATGAGWNNRYGAWPAHPVCAALSPAGLFYAYDVKDTAFPGRVVFVPRSRLPR